MKIKLNQWSRIWVFSCVLFAMIQGYSQTDSIAKQQQDSLLAKQQQQSSLLVSRADSIRQADSVEQAALLEQIANLQASEQQKKVELQARLDSMKQAQEEHNLEIKRQVDSLRVNTPGVPVIVFRDTLFFIYSRLGPFSPNDRAASIVQKLELLMDENLYDPNKLRVDAGIESHDLMHGEMILLSVTDRDAFWLGMSRIQLADHYLSTIKQAVSDYYDQTGIVSTLKRIGLLILVLMIFFYGIRYMNLGLSWVNGKVEEKSQQYLKGVRFRDYEFLSAEREGQFVGWSLNVLKWLFIALVIYLVLPAVFFIFPATEDIATALFGYVLNPLKALILAFVGFIPEIITIFVIIFVTYYFVRFLKFLAGEVEAGKLQLPGFYPDWAWPTFNLLKILIYAFAFVAIFPNLPGSDSPIFQGVTVFLGLLISLGSSSAIGNIIAGLVITYMRPFKMGDRVRIGDTVGDVIEKTMLVTRLRTIKNEDVTIPNAAILSGSTINYSSNAQTQGLILNTTVTIGYDVPWRKVQELLINAALKTEHIKKNPPPFVLQTSLDDFYVSYQINAYTHQAAMAAGIYSQLHSNIQDAFNEAGVEILSPHYRAARDGNMTTIPPDYLPHDYKPPSFQINLNKDEQA